MPRLLDLKDGNVAIIDEADWPLVETLTVYLGTNGYAYFSTWDGKRSVPRTLHSLLIDAPIGMHIDHANGNKLDNRRSNLRAVTPQKNQINRKRPNRNNATGTRGVSFCPKLSKSRPWRAQITVMRRNLHLGMFATAGEAILARRAAERKHYGEECP